MTGLPDEDSEAIERFWAEFLASADPPLPAGLRYFEAFRFGNTEAMINEITPLVLSGVKTATSELLWSRQQGDGEVQQPGDLHIVLDAEGKPACVIETMEIRIIPFEEADAQLAYEYGEGDRTLSWWQEHLWDYYVRECQEHGWEASASMPIVCERFRVLYPSST